MCQTLPWQNGGNLRRWARCRWRFIFRGRESHHPTASLKATDSLQSYFVELTTATHQPTLTNRVAFCPLCCRSLRRTCDIRPWRIPTSSRQFTSQGAETDSLSGSTPGRLNANNSARSHFQRVICRPFVTPLDVWNQHTRHPSVSVRDAPGFQATTIWTRPPHY